MKLEARSDGAGVLSTHAEDILKNCADIIDHAMGLVDFSVNEQCAAYAENLKCKTFYNS